MMAEATGKEREKSMAEEKRLTNLHPTQGF